MRFSSRNVLALALFLSLAATATGCGGSGGSGGGSRSGAPRPPSDGEPEGGGPPGTPDPIPTGARVVLADFEDGRVPAEFHFYGQGLDGSQYNPEGRYIWSIDETQGARGSRRSMKLRVSSGTPYIYFAPHFGGNPVRFLAEGRDVNRLGFYLKLPRGWGQAGSPYFNFHIGWYLSNDPNQKETNNGHFYHHMYLVPGSDWIHVVVADDYDWQRDRGTAGFDPARSAHRLAFDSFFDKVTHFYLTGAPNPGAYEWYAGEYDMWIDEVEMFHVEEEVAVSTGIVRAAPGEQRTVTITNRARGERTYAVRATDYDGAGVDIRDESGAPVETLRLGAGGTRQLRISPRGSGTSNVVIYREANDPHVQDRSINGGYRGGYGGASAGILVVGS